MLSCYNGTGIMIFMDILSSLSICKLCFIVGPILVAARWRSLSDSGSGSRDNTFVSISVARAFALKERVDAYTVHASKNYDSHLDVYFTSDVGVVTEIPGDLGFLGRSDVAVDTH